jgi:hypothetical protein
MSPTRIASHPVALRTRSTSGETLTSSSSVTLQELPLPAHALAQRLRRTPGPTQPSAAGPWHPSCATTTGAGHTAPWETGRRSAAFTTSVGRTTSAQNGGDRRGWFHFPFAPPQTTRSRSRAGSRGKRLKGFEPSTFCMARKAGHGTAIEKSHRKWLCIEL